MSITATMVKALRDRTGAGMMECKKALTENDGDIEASIEWMRKNGMAKAEKKAGRTAAEGLIGIAINDEKTTAALIEVNCETDFVAKNDDFVKFVDDLAQLALANSPATVADLSKLELGGQQVEELRQELVARIGENIQVRRFELIQAATIVGTYLHGGRIGVCVAMKNADESLAKDIAMHVAASRPICVDEDSVPEEILNKEKEILTEQTLQSGKPAAVVDKIIAGRIKKYISEITLLEQPFVKDPDTTVGKLAKSKSAVVESFVRLEVGEGIEKEETDFAEEVMAQAKGS